MALLDDEVVGGYYLKPNFPGRAAHIANAGYAVAAQRRRGIGRLLVEDSLWRAPLLGFDAIQFNLVFAGNPARALYEELGWREIGRLPEAVEGEDAIIYWRASADRSDSRRRRQTPTGAAGSLGVMPSWRTVAILQRTSRRTTHQAGSNSPLARDSRPEVVAAWWLLCRPSPATSQASHWLLVARLS